MFQKTLKIATVIVAGLLLGCLAATPAKKMNVGLGTLECPAGAVCSGKVEGVFQHPAMAEVAQWRCDNAACTSRHRVGDTERVWNVKTTAGIDFLFAQAYGTSPGANGLNYIACSNDSLTETNTSTSLSNEITGNGLARHTGTYAHTTGQATATISYTFTATGAQSVQKCALFSAASDGAMTHVLSFTQRSLQENDQLTITFTITLSKRIDQPSVFEFAKVDPGIVDKNAIRYGVSTF